MNRHRKKESGTDLKRQKEGAAAAGSQQLLMGVRAVSDIAAWQQMIGDITARATAKEEAAAAEAQRLEQEAEEEVRRLEEEEAARAAAEEAAAAKVCVDLD